MVKTLTLREALANSTLSDLRGIATLLNIPNAAASTKGELMEHLMTPLGSAPALKIAIRSLNSDEYMALAALIADGGAVEASPFQAYFGEIRRGVAPPATELPLTEADLIRPRFGEPWPGSAATGQRTVMPQPVLRQPSAAGVQAARTESGDYPARPEFWRSPTSPLESLWYRGLAFGQEVGFTRTLFIPSDVLPILAPLVAAVRPVVTLEPLPGRFQAANAPDLLADLLQFLLLTKREPVRPVHGWRLPKRALIALNSRLSAPQSNIATAQDETETPYIRLVHRLLSELRLITDAGGTLAPAVGAVRWLQQGRLERIKELWELMPMRFHLDETSAIPYSSFDDDERASAARGHILKLIAACPPERWVSLAALSRKLHNDCPQLLRGWHRLGARVLREPNGRLVTVSASWDRVEGVFIREVVSKTLNWFGLVCMEESGDAFCLSRLGAAVLGSRPAPLDDPAPRPIIVQPNFEILVHAEAAHTDLYRLEDFADQVKRDLVSTYTITRNSLRRSLEAGDNVQSILEFLQAASGREPPQNLAYTLRDWASQYGQIQVRRLTVVTTKTEGQLQELMAHPKLKLTVAEPLGAQAVAVEDKEIRPLLASLRRAGYMPIVEAGVDDTPARPSTLIPVRDVDLVPLMAAARLVCQLAGAEVIASPLLERLDEQLGAANAEEVARAIGRLEDAVSDGTHASDKEKLPAARFNTARTLPILETAIRKRLTVQLEYYEESKGSIVRQQVDPWRLERRRGQEYMVGFSHATLAERLFLLAHIRSVTPTRDRFDPVAR